MAQLLIAITVLGLLLYAVLQPDPATLKRYWRQGLLWVGLGLLVVMALTGRLHWLFALAAGGYALIRRLLPLLPMLMPTLRRLWSKAQDGGEAPRSQAESGMTLEEAREILGVDEHADEAAIISAHRRLMQKIHPDRGGSSYLASRVNKAKRRLLNR